MKVYDHLTSCWVFSNSFPYNSLSNNYYTVYILFRQCDWSYKLILKWAYGATAMTEIPMSNVFLPTLVGSSPYNIALVNSICGDSRKTGTENWDDGNINNGDGWRSNWDVEPGWSCSGGNASTKDIWVEVWGDGTRFNSLSTYWDDGNLSSGDGCSSTCLKENGWSWVGGDSTSKDTWTEIWGDGIRINTLSTYCDDGNVFDGDGCRSNCSIETGWHWNGGNISTKDTWVEMCGDGIKFNSISSYWDDGNTLSNDGWDSLWNIESGWSWSGGSSSTKDAWNEDCGDSRRFNSLTTYCDDGNTSSNDGWDFNWNIETGWSWSGGSTTAKDTWSEIWGDRIKFNSNSTYCDDGNNVDGDGWSSNWAIETGWSCSGGNSSTKDSWNEVWGDGVKFNSLSTYCDDGNTSDNDGWSSKWSIEVGWNCSGGNSSTKDSWNEICGDGKRFNTISSYCDDGNLLNNDGWNTLCTTESEWKWSGGNITTKDHWNKIENQDMLEAGQAVSGVVTIIASLFSL